MAGEALLITQFAAAVTMVMLAVALLWLDARNRVVRVFAAFLLVRAALTAGPGLARVDPPSMAAVAALLPAYQLAGVAVLAYFLIVHLGSSRTANRAALVLIVVGAAGLEVVFFLRPCWLECVSSEGVSTLGPLGAVPLAFATLAGLGALLLARRAMRAPSAHSRTSTLLVALGLGCDAILTGTLVLGGLLGDGPRMVAAYVHNAWWWMAFALPLAGAGFAYATIAALARRRDPAVPRMGALFVAVGIAGTAIGFVSIRERSIAALQLLALLRLILPLAIGYGLLRYRLFDIDMRARWTLSRATVGAVFAGVFFVVSESVAAIVGERSGLFVGLLAAALLLLALAPLQRAAERLVDASVGSQDPLTIEEKRAMYRELAQRAWGDGSLRREERVFLEELRARLQLSAEDALRLEAEVSSTQSVNP